MKTGICRRTEKERLSKVGGISFFEQKQRALEKQIKKGKGIYIHLMRLYGNSGGRKNWEKQRRP